MRITNLKAQVKNPNRVSIFVEGKYSFSLSIEQVVELKIKNTQEVTEADIKHFKKLSDDGKLRGRALEWLMTRPHSERELRDYLYRKKVEKEQIENLVEWAKTKGYQDDSRFAEWFADLRLRKNKSWRAIQSELKSKGVDQVTIQNIANEAGGFTNDENSLEALIEKLRTKTRYQDEKKLIAYLISKGFLYGDIKQALAGKASES